MLSISMVNNVISCKKIERNTQKSKSLIPLYKLGSHPQKTTKIAKKNRSLNRDLLTYFYSYDMFWMRPVESSCPGGSEFCVIKGGRRCFRISNGRPKFTLFKNNKKPICCVQIKCKSRNFQN